MIIREVVEKDLNGLLALYMQLHDNAMPEINNELKLLWESILNDKNQHIIIAVEDNKIVSSCVVVIVPNLTHHQQPYALIENVITDINYRKRGYGTTLLNFAKEMAIKANCYKLMLLTGSKEDSTLKFYEQAGYNRNDKTGFIQWI